MKNFNKWSLIAPDQSESIEFLSSLGTDRWNIGTGKKCDIHVDGDFIGKEHLKVKRAGTSIFATAPYEKDFPVFINGLPIGKKQELMHGDQITLGSVKLFYVHQSHDLNEKVGKLKKYAIGLVILLILMGFNDWYHLSEFKEALKIAEDHSEANDAKGYNAFTDMDKSFTSMIFFGLADTAKMHDIAATFINNTIEDDINVAVSASSDVLRSGIYDAPFYKSFTKSDPKMAPTEDFVREGLRQYTEYLRKSEDEPNFANFELLLEKYPFLRPFEQ